MGRDQLLHILEQPDTFSREYGTFYHWCCAFWEGPPLKSIAQRCYLLNSVPPHPDVSTVMLPLSIREDRCGATFQIPHLHLKSKQTPSGPELFPPSHRNKVEETSRWLYPLHVLSQYVLCTATSGRHHSCFLTGTHELWSKQRLSRWLCDAITQACSAIGVEPPQGF